MDLSAIAAGKQLKKTETVVKGADLKSQVAGEKDYGTDDSGIKADALSAVTLKKAETVVKEASLKDQVAGEKASALGTNPMAAALKEAGKAS